MYLSRTIDFQFIQRDTRTILLLQKMGNLKKERKIIENNLHVEELEKQDEK